MTDQDDGYVPEPTDPAALGWAVVEVMGHRRLGGHLSEAIVAGRPFLRIDIPAEEWRKAATQFYPASALFSLTPSDEETARAANPKPFGLNRLALPGVERDDDWDDDRD